MAQLYVDLDRIHPFHEGNSRTLREFTRSLALAAGYDLSWTSTNVDAAE
jgi:fido (protein-threonine AMPylation protein)